MKKYYFDEHETAYQEMKKLNIFAWDEYHDPDNYNFDNFMMRPFLDKFLDYIKFDGKGLLAFEYGCGTGAGACFLAEKGFQVDAIDISPTAIEIAKSISSERGLDINYKVQDLLELPSLDNKYDLVLDNYCLQSIVTDQDRAKLFSIIYSELSETGYYIIASAMYNESRNYGKDSYYCNETGIVYDKVNDYDEFPDAIRIKDNYWIPNRRHLKEDDLRDEIMKAGFSILLQEGGNIICKK